MDANYGSGLRPRTLSDEIAKVRYPGLDLSLAADQSARAATHRLKPCDVPVQRVIPTAVIIDLCEPNLSTRWT